jgi:hypothetical protein
LSISRAAIRRRFDDQRRIAGGIVHLPNPIAPNLTFPFEVSRRRGECSFDSVDQGCFRTRWYHPAALIINKLWDTGNCGSDDWPTQSEGFHDYHWQPFSEARQNESTGLRQVGADLRAGANTRKSNHTAQATSADVAFDRGA